MNNPIRPDDRTEIARTDIDVLSQAVKTKSYIIVSSDMKFSATKLRGEKSPVTDVIDTLSYDSLNTGLNLIQRKSLNESVLQLKENIKGNRISHFFKMIFSPSYREVMEDLKNIIDVNERQISLIEKYFGQEID
jgi:hypothetical protein